jgi:hypothetical protein
MFVREILHSPICSYHSLFYFLENDEWNDEWYEYRRVQNFTNKHMLIFFYSLNNFIEIENQP